MTARSLVVDVVFDVDQRLERLLAAHHLGCTYRDTALFVALLGPVENLSYALALQRFCDELNLHHTWLGSDESEALAAAGPDPIRLGWLPAHGDAGIEVLADALVALAARRKDA